MPTPPPAPEEKGKTLKCSHKNFHVTYAGGSDQIGMMVCDDCECLLERCPYPDRHYASLEGELKEALKALEGVVRIADRKTLEFDAARTVLAKHTTASPQGK